MPSAPEPARRTLLDRVSGNAGKIAVIAGAVSAVLALWPGELWDRTFAKPEVEVTQRALQNPPVPSIEAYEAAGAAGIDTTPLVAVTLANTGRKDLRIDRVAATIEDYAGFGACATGSGSGSGDIPSSAAVTVPLDGKYDAKPSASVDKIVQAGDTHRFAIRLQQLDRLKTQAIYALRLRLLTDDDPVDLGRYVVTVPQGFAHLDADSFPISGQSAPLYGPRYTVADTWCYRAQLAALQRVLSQPGERSAETKRLAAAQLSPGWERYASPSSPERAIPKLLKGDGAVYALEAAKATGDLATTQRVIAALRKRAGELLETAPVDAAFVAESVYEVTGDAADRQLVDRARLLAEQDMAAAADS